MQNKTSKKIKKIHELSARIDRSNNARPKASEVGITKGQREIMADALERALSVAHDLQDVPDMDQESFADLIEYVGDEFTSIGDELSSETRAIRDALETFQDD